MDKILKIQSEIGVLSKTETNPFFKSKYMDINGLLAQLLPLLTKYELTVVQPLSHSDGRPSLRTVVYLEKEKIIDDSILLPDLQDPQKMGSAITYYRRYALQSLFLLQAQDDDANYASKEPTIQLGEKRTTVKEMKEISKKSNEDYDNGNEPF